MDYCAVELCWDQHLIHPSFFGTVKSHPPGPPGESQDVPRPHEMHSTIPPTYSQSALRSLPSWICPEYLQKDKSRRRPYQIVAPFHAQSHSVFITPHSNTQVSVQRPCSSRDVDLFLVPSLCWIPWKPKVSHFLDSSAKWAVIFWPYQTFWNCKEAWV